MLLEGVILEPDVKYRILIALYMEYLRIAPSNARITPELIEVDNDLWFFIGLRKLEIENCITGVPAPNPDVFQGLQYNMNAISITKHGIEIIEEIFGVQSVESAEFKFRLIQISGHAPDIFKEFVIGLTNKLTY